MDPRCWLMSSRSTGSAHGSRSDSAGWVLGRGERYGSLPSASEGRGHSVRSGMAAIASAHGGVPWATAVDTGTRKAGIIDRLRIPR